MVDAFGMLVRLTRVREGEVLDTGVFVLLQARKLILSDVRHLGVVNNL